MLSSLTWPVVSVKLSSAGKSIQGHWPTTLTVSLIQEVYRVQEISEEIPTFRDCKSVKKISYSPFVLFIFWEVGEWWLDTYSSLGAY